MVSTADIASLRAENDALADMAGQDLNQLFTSLNLEDPYAARDLLLETVPELTNVYGDATSTIAADWYDDIRYTERVPGDFRALMAEPFPPDYVQKRIRYGASHLFTDTPELMLPFLQGALQKFVLQPGRDTIQQSSMADPKALGWKRVARADACRFCLMLAAKGAVYQKNTVTFSAHDWCSCGCAPSWDTDAPEVPVVAYKASERRFGKSQEWIDAHNEELREYLDTHYPVK